jgi:hypothetical protein
MQHLMGLNDLHWTAELVKNLFDLFSDIVTLYGEGLIPTLKRSTVPQMLSDFFEKNREWVNNEEFGHRFHQSINLLSSA